MSENGKNMFHCSGASIKVEGITKKFGKLKALDGISFSIEPGTVFALLGPNGSGKTTTVRILTTLLKADRGRASVGDYDVASQPQAVRKIIGLAGQYPVVDENLTGKENLVMIGQLYHLGGPKSKTRANELLDIFTLTEAANRRVKTYSGGMRRRLDLAAALVANPPLLFLDEPTTGLDPRSRLNLWEVITQQAKNCNTVFLTTQYLEEADRLANKIAIMDNGRVIRGGTPQELKDCCGGDTHVNMKLEDRSRMSEAVDILKNISQETIRTDEETGEIRLPSAGKTSVLAEVVRRMDSAGITLTELGLKQPTLDDVFLAITGHTVSQETKTDTDGKDHG